MNASLVAPVMAMLLTVPGVWAAILLARTLLSAARTAAPPLAMRIVLSLAGGAGVVLSAMFALFALVLDNGWFAPLILVTGVLVTELFIIRQIHLWQSAQERGTRIARDLDTTSRLMELDARIAAKQDGFIVRCALNVQRSLLRLAIGGSRRTG